MGGLRKSRLSFVLATAFFDLRPIEIVAGAGDLAKFPVRAVLVIEGSLPRFGKRLGIVHLDVELEVVAIDATEALGDLQVTAMRMTESIEPRPLVKADRLYLERQSFWLDARLIALSFWISFRGKWEAKVEDKVGRTPRP